MKVIITDDEGTVLDTISDHDHTDYKPDDERDDRSSFVDRCSDAICTEYDRITLACGPKHGKDK